MIAGKGVIANSCLSIDHSNILIFASGVSNSTETRISEFNREKDLFIKLVKKSNWDKVVYFSTCSVLDLSLHETPYVQFKLKMEEYILNSIPKSVIIRLPQVFGCSKNKSQLGNFLFQSIIKNQTFTLQKDACRYLILSRNIGSIVKLILNNYSKSQPLNVAFSNQCNIQEIVSHFEKNIGISAKYNLINKGSCYKIDNSDFLSMLNNETKFELEIEVSAIVKAFIEDCKQLEKHNAS